MRLLTRGLGVATLAVALACAPGFAGSLGAAPGINHGGSGSGGGPATSITVGTTDVVGTCVFAGQAGLLFKDPSTGKVQCNAGLTFDPTTDGLHLAGGGTAGVPEVNFRPNFDAPPAAELKLFLGAITDVTQPPFSFNRNPHRYTLDISSNNLDGEADIAVNDSGAANDSLGDVPSTFLIEDSGGAGLYVGGFGAIHLFTGGQDFSNEAWDITATGDLTSVGAGRNIAASGSVQHGHVAFGSLPTCNAGAEGMHLMVDDATTCTFNVDVVAAGGGTIKCPAVCNGTSWIGG